MPRPPVDAAAEIADGETRDQPCRRCWHWTAKPMARRGDAVMLGERRQDRLRGEQIDHGQERRERDDDEAEERRRWSVHGSGFGVAASA